MEWLTYLLKVSACLAFFFAFYLVFLRKLTFFRANRFYLLTTLLLSFVIPALNVEIEKVAPQAVNRQAELQQIELGQMVSQTTAQVIERSFDWSLLLAVIYGLAAAGLLLLAAWRLFQLLKYANGHTQQINGLKLVPKSSGFTNCSFLNYVFIDQQNLNEHEVALLLKHEEVHAKEYHSLDKLLLTIIKAILWFNPIIYLFDKALEQMHEYDADERTSSDMGTQSYASLLLRLAAQGYQTPLVHNFVKSPIKERIKMLYQSKSKNMKKLSYVLALPIATALVWGFAVNVVYAQSKVEEVKTTRPPVERVVGTGTGQVIEVRSLKRSKGNTANERIIVEGVRTKGITGTAATGENVIVENVRVTGVAQAITVPGREVVTGRTTGRLNAVTIQGTEMAVGGGVNTGVGGQISGRNGSRDEVSVTSIARARNNQVSEVRVNGMQGTVARGIEGRVVRQAGLYLSKEKIALIIDKNTTKQQLEDYKAKLKEKNVDLKINEIKLDADQKVTYIEFSIDCNDGFKGSASGSPATNGSIGFYRSYNKSSSSPFGMGSGEEN